MNDGFSPDERSNVIPFPKRGPIHVDAAEIEVQDFDVLDVPGSIDALLTQWNLEVRYDGTIRRRGIPEFAARPEDVRGFFEAEPMSERDLLDDICLHCHRMGLKIALGLLKAGLRRVVRERKKNRRFFVLKPYLDRAPLDREAIQRPWALWATLFDMPADLAVACGQHFIWQVKRKQLGLPVSHHLMIIVYSAAQGSGKTTFVRRLAGPLKELASADVLISDFVDRRSGDVYGYPVVIIDDMEQITGAAVAYLKSLLTSRATNRRKLFTSHATTTRQLATLIGTANRPVHELVDDDTGHRRFVMMPFRNGNVAKGGDAAIWEVVNSLDYERLWLSVDAYADSPILPHLADLHMFQNIDRPIPKLQKWLRELDMSSLEIKNISVVTGVRADRLRELYVQQTGDVVTRQKFADEMSIYMADDSTPFSAKYRREVGAVYRVRPGRGWVQ